MAAEAKTPGTDPEYVVPVPEEMSLPSAAIQRIIKTKLPDGVMIGKEAKVAFSKSASIFILYVTTMCAREGPSPIRTRTCVARARTRAPTTQLFAPQRQRPGQGVAAHDRHGAGRAERAS